VWEGESKFAVAVRLEEEERSSRACENLLIATPTAPTCPVGVASSAPLAA